MRSFVAKNAPQDDKSWGALDEEVEGEEEEAEKEEEGAPGKAATGELGHGLNEAGGDNDQARLTAALVERANGYITREIAAKGGKLVVHPEGKFVAMTPQGICADNKNTITETG